MKGMLRLLGRDLVGVVVVGGGAACTKPFFPLWLPAGMPVPHQ